MILTGTQDSSRRENRPASRNSEQKELKPIEIDGRDLIRSVAFLADGKHFVSGGSEGKIRRRRVEDGQEVGTPMNAGSIVLSIAVSRDEKWIVSGSFELVMVWNAESHSKVTEWKAHSDWVQAVDVSRDGTRIATGSDDKTVCVWFLSTGQRLLGPLQHDSKLAGLKFSPNGRLIATATWGPKVRICDSYNGSHCLVEFPIQVYSAVNQSLTWANDSKQLFVLSNDGNIHCLDVSTGTTLSKWAIHGSDKARCISLASNGTFIAVSANSSVSFWDTATHERIGTVIEHTHVIKSMAISANYDVVVGGERTITLRGLCDILPYRYFDNVRLHEKTVTSLSNHNPLR